MIKTVYFMRHGETDLNRENKLQGQIDFPLNEQGRQQARLAGERFRQKGIHFDRVYSSPLIRAVETAALVSGIDMSAILRDERLLEISYGPYEAVAFGDLGEGAFAFFRDPEHVEAPKGMESIQSLMHRTGEFLESLKADREVESVLAVTHGVAIRAVLGHLTGYGTAVWGISIENCALYETTLSENLVFSKPHIIEQEKIN